MDISGLPFIYSSYSILGIYSAFRVFYFGYYSPLLIGSFLRFVLACSFPLCTPGLPSLGCFSSLLVLFVLHFLRVPPFSFVVYPLPCLLHVYVPLSCCPCTVLPCHLDPIWLPESPFSFPYYVCHFCFYCTFFCILHSYSVSYLHIVCLSLHGLCSGRRTGSVSVVLCLGRSPCLFLYFLCDGTWAFYYPVRAPTLNCRMLYTPRVIVFAYKGCGCCLSLTSFV